MANPLFDNLRPASFRGVQFQVEGTSMSAGRRVQLHEYPQRDKPYAQDMGRASRAIRFRAFVIGSDYIVQADHLLAALETNGPGVLVHPWFGKLNVNALDVAEVEFDSGLGVAQFELSFVESGELTFPSQSVATQTASKAAAATLQTQATSFFAQVFKVAGFVNSVAQQALKIYGNVQSLIANPAGYVARWLGLGSLAGNLSSLYAAFSSPITVGQTHANYLSLASASASYPRNDAQLANGINGLIQLADHPAIADPLGISSVNAPAAANPALPPDTSPASSSLAMLYLSQATAYRQAPPLALSPWGYLPYPVFSESNPPLTPSQQQKYVNVTIIYLHTRITLLVQAVGISALMPCTVYDVAIAVRDSLCDALDREAQALSSFWALLPMAQTAAKSANLPALGATADALNALYGALMTARAAVYNDLTFRSANSARLITVKLTAVVPALVVAYEQYEDASRESEIVSRNHIQRPGFVPAGTVNLLSQ